MGAGALPLAGCDQDAVNARVLNTLKSAEKLTYAAQRLILPRAALAPEYAESDIAPRFRPNGSVKPRARDYAEASKNDFAAWRLKVGGLVETPLELSLADLKAMPARTQITRHDCVEGWSCVGKWTGVPLAAVLDKARPKAEAKFVLFRCFDSPDTDEEGAAPPDAGSAAPDLYYESVDMEDARHPQTILAYGLNGAPLPVADGAPLRVRVERQLGYKMAKFLKSVELVADLKGVGGGKGGYWEDRGYEWYAGI